MSSPAKLPGPFAARATGIGVVLAAAAFCSPVIVAGIGAAAVAGHLAICRARLRELERLARLQAQVRQARSP